MPGIFTYNGNEFSMTSANIDFGGTRFYGVSALNVNDELTPEDVYGNGMLPVSRTAGIYKAGGDFEQLLSEYMLLIGKLGDGYGLVPFNIGCQYRETPGAGLVKVEIIGARIIKQELSNAQGGAGTKMKASLSIIQPILFNGKSIAPRRQSPGLRVSSALIDLATKAGA